MGLALERADVRCDDCRAVLTEGQQIAWRRDRLGWNQRTLAKRAGVGLATVTRIEKDRNVQQATVKAVLSALDAGEAQRPDLLHHKGGQESSTPTKEGADAKARRAVAQLERLEVLMIENLEDLRRIKHMLLEDVDAERRKRANER